MDNVDKEMQEDFFFPLPLALQPIVGFGLLNNALPFFPISH